MYCQPSCSFYCIPFQDIHFRSPSGHPFQFSFSQVNPPVMIISTSRSASEQSGVRECIFSLRVSGRLIISSLDFSRCCLLLVFFRSCRSGCGDGTLETTFMLRNSVLIRCTLSHFTKRFGECYILPVQKFQF